ncbi:unnamed protein product [Brachionus calyciflorus]|uniref:Uncharacterized protein n=1 Tax=Brachionus calyciflorus TaxID=104777 RepID=A0A814RB96_9BILA|nr:unnamed protein product [Brachionus calyciflorus]
MIEDEKSLKGDGFISRFLICCPKPVRLKLRQLKKLDLKFNLEKLLIAIRVLHLNDLEYEFDDLSLELLENEIEHYDSMCEAYELKNCFIGSVFEIESLDDNTLVINRLKSKSIINKISSETVQRAIKINKYYLDQKLILAGIVSGEKLTDILEINQGSSNLRVNDLERIILLEPGSVIFAGEISKNNKSLKKEKFIEISKKMENEKLGFLRFAAKEESQKRSNCFEKINFEELDEDEKIEFVNSLLKYNVSIDKYKESFNPIVIININNNLRSQTNETDDENTTPRTSSKQKRPLSTLIDENTKKLA